MFVLLLQCGATSPLTSSLSGWLCTISFCKNWIVPCILKWLLKKGESFSGDVEQLLRPNTISLRGTSGFHAMWCQFQHVFPWQKLKYFHRQGRPHRVFGDRYLCKAYNVVISRLASVIRLERQPSFWSLRCVMTKLFSFMIQGFTYKSFSSRFWLPSFAHKCFHRKLEWMPSNVYCSRYARFCISTFLGLY